MIDGEAVLLGVDGRSDFDGLHSRQHDEEVQFYAFDMLVNSTEAKPAPHGTLLRVIARLWISVICPRRYLGLEHAMKQKIPQSNISLPQNVYVSATAAPQSV